MIMKLKQIPDVQYAVDDDPDLLIVEQGQVESVRIALHRMHIDHFAKVMNIADVNRLSAPSELWDLLRDMRDQAEDLFCYLNSVPCFPPGGSVTEDVQMASRLMKMADRACATIGIETGNIPLAIDEELAAAIGGTHE
jgi:hypothetical protein